MGKRKLTTEELLQAVKENLTNGVSVREISRRYQVDKTMIRWAIAQYKSQGATALYEHKHNNVYSEELKKEAVLEYLDGKGSLLEISAKYGLRSNAQLRNWIKVYNSGNGFGRKMSGGSRMKGVHPTTVEERVQIAKDCIANGGNYGETALKYNVSYQQVYQWTKKFKEKGPDGLEDRRGKRLKDQTPRTREEELEIEVARLKHELYITQMERDLLKKLEEVERREAYRK